MRAPVEDSLDRWMARLADGDRAAFDPLFRALYPRALRLARVKLGDAPAADAAQSAMVRVFARAGEFEAGRPVLPWFYAVVANEIRTASRSDGRGASRVGERLATSDGLEDVAADADDPERALLAAELRAALAAAIDGLDAPSAEAIAAILGEGARPALAPDAFRKRVSRAYARLRVLLGGLR